MNLSFIILLLLFSPLLIANAETDALFEMSLQELMHIEIQGSTKTPKSRLNVPGSVTVFTQKEIQNMGLSTLEELKNFVPGFQSRRSGNSSISRESTTRGFTAGVANRDILVLIDGQRINTDASGGTGVVTPVIPLENIKKVEFIRGAGSALYGSNAFSAVINLTTINDKNEFSVRVSDVNVKSVALVSVKDEDFKFSGFVKVVNDTGKTYNNPYNTIANNTTKTKDSYDSLDVYLQAFYKDFSLYISHSSNNIKDFYMLKLLSNDNKRSSDLTYIRAKYDFKYNKFDSQIAISFTEANDDIDNLDLTPNLFGSTNIKEQTPSVEFFSSYTINENNSLEFGMEYRKSKIVNATVKYNAQLYSNPSTPNFTYPLLDETSRDVFGLYVQYQSILYEKLHLTLGLRLDDYSDFGSSIHPRTALVYNLNEQTSIKLLYSSAFRAPSRKELDLQNNGVTSGNKNLKAEEINSYEFIVSYKYLSQILNISLYKNDMKNMIAIAGINYENIGSDTHIGTEIEYEAVLFEDFQVRFTYSHIFNQPDKDFRASSNLASTILNYRYKKINFNFSGYFNDSVYNDFGTYKEKLDSYIIANTKIGYLYTKKLKLYVQANNLFDNDYYTPTDNTKKTFNIPNRGIEVFVGLEYRF